LDEYFKLLEDSAPYTFVHLMTYEPKLLVAQPNFTINVVSNLYWRVSWRDAVWWVCPPLPYLNVDNSESCTSLTL